MANGSLKVFKSLVDNTKEMNIDVNIELKEECKGLFFSKSRCQGFCQNGPLVSILPAEILYTKVKIGDAKKIIEQSVKNGNIIDRLCYHNAEGICKKQNEIPFYKAQNRLVLKQCGTIDPENIKEYISDGGYGDAKKACVKMTDQEICSIVLESGLRGRGGGWFFDRQKVGFGKETDIFEKIYDL
ncbi:hypothetical protein AGMMS49921_01860 [Endomicrobiia bacterium]|nr:hypothetical protein AGMMS49921_01860 [Endomicrobiia bacterium]